MLELTSLNVIQDIGGHGGDKDKASYFKDGCVCAFLCIPLLRQAVFINPCLVDSVPAQGV